MLLCLPRQMLLAGIIDDTFSGTKGQKLYANIGIAILSSNFAEFGRKSLTIVKITINQKFRIIVFLLTQFEGLTNRLRTAKRGNLPDPGFNPVD